MTAKRLCDPIAKGDETVCVEQAKYSTDYGSKRISDLAGPIDSNFEQLSREKLRDLPVSDSPIACRLISRLKASLIHIQGQLAAARANEPTKVLGTAPEKVT